MLLAEAMEVVGKPVPESAGHVRARNEAAPRNNLERGAPAPPCSRAVDILLGVSRLVQCESGRHTSKQDYPSPATAAWHWASSSARQVLDECSARRGLVHEDKITDRDASAWPLAAFSEVDPQRLILGSAGWPVRGEPVSHRGYASAANVHTTVRDVNARRRLVERERWRWHWHGPGTKTGVIAMALGA